MDTLHCQFDAAVTASKSLPEKPDNMTLLKIYGLYKQATQGDVEGDQPGLTDFVARAKWQAWDGHRGMDSAAAMQAYIDLIDSLR
jgi:acyl-CoA-binding protein